MDQITELLSELGLGLKEIEILKFLYINGGAYASTLTNHLKIQRSSCYEFIKHLKQLGFVSQIYRNDTLYFLPIEFSALFERWKIKQQIMNRQFNQIQLDFNKSNTNPTISPHSKVHYFAGKEGIKSVLFDIFKSHPSKLCCYVSRDLNKYIDRNIPEFSSVRINHNIFARVISPLSEIKNGKPLNDQDMKRETRFLPDNFDLRVDYLIYGHKIAIISVPENFGLIIESESVSRAQALLFNFAWNQAEKLKI